MSLKVLHSFPVWLPQTQTWLYQQVRSLPSDITSFIACKETMHSDQFGLPNIHALCGPAGKMSRFTTRLFHHLDFHAYTRYLCHKLEPDILHSHFGPVGWKNFQALRPFASKSIKNIKQVVTFYGQDVDHLPKVSPVWKSRYREMFRRIDLVLCEGNHMAEKVKALGCPPDRIQVNHLGVDLDRIAFIPRIKREDEPFRVLMAAAFRPKKGYLYGLKALESLISKYDIEITLVGDATGDVESLQEKESIKKLVKSSKLSGKVRFTGFLSQESLYKESLQHHLYLAPSVTAENGDSEGGAPVSIIEMSAGGMPVVSSRHCDIPEVIQEGKSGLLANERDITGLAEKLSYLFDNPGKWLELSQNARKHLEEEYDAKKQGKRLSDLYEMILNRPLAQRILTEKSQSKQSLTLTRPRLLFISHSGDLYGSERSLLTLLSGLKSMDIYDIMVFLPSAGALSAKLKQHQISFKIIPFTRWIGSRHRLLAPFYRWIKNKLTFRSLYHDALAFDPDLIYTNTLSTPAGAWLSKRLLRRPVHLWHARELPGNPLHHFGFFDFGNRYSLRFVFQYSDKVIANSHFLSNALASLFTRYGLFDKKESAKNKIRVVYNGIDMDEPTVFQGDGVKRHDPLSGSTKTMCQDSTPGFDKPEAALKKTDSCEKRVEKVSEYQLVMAGGISGVKNYPEAIEAMKLLVKEGIPAKLDIFGSGSFKEGLRLKKLIKKAGLESHITLRGYEADMAGVYSGASLLLLVSKMETFGRVAIEAMQHGLPVVASDAGALPEIIKDGENGLLYPLGSPEILVQQIKKICQDQHLRNRLIKNGIGYARNNFSADRYILEMHTLFQEVLPLNKRLNKEYHYSDGKK